MNDWGPRSEDRKEDVCPPFSRLFVVCSKNFKEEELKKPFLKFGDIENFYMPRDRQTGESKGVAYIKFCLTSSAAAAIEELNDKCIGHCNKPIKVMIANHKDDKDRTKPYSDKGVRLFIRILQTDTESTIAEHFSTFGELLSVSIVKNKWKVAYVTFKTFYAAAKAYEQCDNKYKAVFAAPKEELKRGRDSFEQNMGSPSISSCSLNKRDKFHDISFRDNHLNGNPTFSGHYVSQRISVTVSPPLDEKYIRSLFNIVSGMEDFQYSQDLYNGVTKAIITYADQNSTACAVERLNNFQFPSGEIVSVALDNPITKAATEISNLVNCLKSAIGAGDPSSGLVQLADAIAQASSLIATAKTEQDSKLCSITLPPVQPMADSQIVAKRCFIVCKPHPPPFQALKDVFCRFGDLIDIITYPNRTYGFVKYASEKAALEAIKTLDGITVCGSFLKVMEADDRQTEVAVDIEQKKRIKMNEDHQLVECLKD